MSIFVARGRPDGQEPSSAPIPDRQDGKDRAFREEALPHLDAIRAFSLRLSGSSSDADDLVQDTYLRAYRYWHHYTPGTRCRSWLFRICRNLFVRRWRRRARHRELLAENAGPQARPPAPGRASCFGSSPDDPDRSSLARIVAEEVHRALDALPDPYREAVRLRLVEELEYGEVAEVLDVPVGTVKSRVHRGRQMLRRKLSGYAP